MDSHPDTHMPSTVKHVWSDFLYCYLNEKAIIVYQVVLLYFS